MSKRRFPTTRLPAQLWPGFPIEEPLIWRSKAAVLDDDWLVWVGPATYSADGLPLELVIRELLDLDLSDRSAVVETVNTYGLISERHPRVRLGVPHGTTFLDTVTNAHGIEERDRQVRAQAAEQYGHHRANHWADVREFLLDAQRLAKTWIAFMDGDYVWPTWFVDDDVRRDAKGRREWVDTMESLAWQEFTAAFNEGMKHITVRAELTWDPDVKPLGKPTVGLFSALCAQLHNLMVSEVEELRTCANGTCGHRFTRQRGGAEHGQYRSTGVMYCTVRCAKTQGQRELRRRRKEQQ